MIEMCTKIWVFYTFYRMSYQFGCTDSEGWFSDLILHAEDHVHKMSQFNWKRLMRNQNTLKLTTHVTYMLFITYRWTAPLQNKWWISVIGEMSTSANHRPNGRQLSRLWLAPFLQNINLNFQCQFLLFNFWINDTRIYVSQVYAPSLVNTSKF